MSVAVIHWEGPISSLAGPRADGYGMSLPIPSVSTIRGLIGAAMGVTTGYEGPLDIAVVVHDPGEHLSDFRTADLSQPRMRARWVMSDGSIRQRGGASGKNRATGDRPLVAGYRATILVEGEDAERINLAFSDPHFAPCLGARDCIPTRPLAGGVRDEGLDEVVVDVGAGTVYRLSKPGALRFGAEIISLPERDGPPSWWARR